MKKNEIKGILKERLGKSSSTKFTAAALAVALAGANLMGCGNSTPVAENPVAYEDNKVKDDKVESDKPSEEKKINIIGSQEEKKDIVNSDIQNSQSNNRGIPKELRPVITYESYETYEQKRVNANSCKSHNKQWGNNIKVIGNNVNSIKPKELPAVELNSIKEDIKKPVSNLHIEDEKQQISLNNNEKEMVEIPSVTDNKEQINPSIEENNACDVTSGAAPSIVEENTDESSLPTIERIPEVTPAPTVEKKQETKPSTPKEEKKPEVTPAPTVEKKQEIKPNIPKEEKKPEVTPAPTVEKKQEIKPNIPKEEKKPEVIPAPTVEKKQETKPSTPKEEKKPEVTPAPIVEKRPEIKPVVSKDEKKPVIPPSKQAEPVDAFSKHFEEVMTKEMYRLVNEHRKNNKLKAYGVLNGAEELSKLKSKDMHVRNYFDHRDANGKYNWQNYTQYGDMHGENILMKSLNVNKKYTDKEIKDVAYNLFDMWKNSPGHNANMLRDSFNEIGFGIYLTKDRNGLIYATQTFR